MSALVVRRLLTASAKVAALALVFLAGGLMLPRMVSATINSGERDAFVPLPPGRVLDTRFGPSPTGVGVKLASGDAGVIDLPVLGQQGVPAAATAVVLNITVVNASASSHLTLWPTGTARPLASSTNFVPGTTVPNAVTVKVGTGGKVSIFNNHVGSGQIADGSVTMADLDTDSALFAVTFTNGTTLTPGQCLIRAASNGTIFTPGKLATATFESGTIPDNVAFFAGTTKAGTTPGSGFAPFQTCNTSTSANVVFAGATFNLRIRVIN